MTSRLCVKWSTLAALTTSAVLALFAAPEAAHAANTCIPRETSASLSTPSTPPSDGSPDATATPEPPLYPIGDQIFTLDRDGTIYYYFQGNRDGSAKVKRELRYDRNLWNTCAQLQVRLPFITRYPNAPSSLSPQANPYTGFGNAEL